MGIKDIKNKTKIKLAITAVAVTIFIVAGVNFNSEKKIDVRVKVAEVTVGNMNESLIFEGVVVPKESEAIYVEAPTIIDKLLVKEGDEVNSGEKLILFSATSKIKLERQLQSINLDIKNMDMQLGSLKSGSITLELQNRELEIKSLEENIRRLGSQLGVLSFEAKTLRQEADAKMDLLEKDSIASVEANAAFTSANRKELDYENTKNDMELSKQRYQLMVGSYEGLKRELSMKEITMNGERQKLLLTKANITDTIKKIGEPLRAPVNGVITDILVEEGSAAETGRKIMEIAIEGASMIRMQIPVYQAQWLGLDQEAVVSMKDAQSEKIYSGKVSRVSQSAKLVQSGSYEDRVIEVDVSLADSKGLKPGYSATVEIAGSSRNAAKLVDAFSVVEENRKSYVYVYDGGKVAKTPIDVGAKTMSKYEVLNLAEGTKIVVNPFKVKDGQSVKVENH